MKTILFVMLQMILASGILYGYYHLMLRNKRFHQYNRFYLLASVTISVLIPFLNIPVYFEETEIQSSMVLQTLQTISSTGPEIETITTSVAVSPAVSTSFNWNVVLYFFYWFAASLLFLRILVSLKKIITIIKNNPVEELNGIRFINTIEPGTPYSFFRWLFWNKKIELRSEKGEQIFRHEIFHIQQKHSLDIIFMELLTVIFWINPFFHLMKKEIKAIHEFLADQFAAHKTEKWEYAELLLMQALNTQQHLVNPFFHNQIKRRIAMITNPKKTSHRYLRKLLVLPVAAIVLLLFAFKYKNKTVPDAMRSDEPITIVIDAGHGGIDAGAKSKDGKYTEAQLTLQIAKKIQELSGEYNIKVWMTRQDVNLPGNAATINDGLKKRIEICEQATPFVFISIHMNSNEGSNANSGFEAAITGKKEIPASALLASAFLQNISSVYKVNDKPVKMPEGSVFVLDKNLYPAVLLQCGYISNAEDLAFITRDENQEKLARSILETIVKYKKQITGEANIPLEDTVPPKKQVNDMDNDLFLNSIIVIDGVIMGKMSKADLEKKLEEKKLKVEDFIEVNILKGNTAIDKYGQKGKDGVIEITTKKKVTVKIRDVGVDQNGTKGDENIIFEKVEIEPAFPGGQGSWKKFLEKNLNASVAVENHAPAGEYTVFIQFIVHKDGHISDVKPLTKYGFGMEQEAMRIIKESPKKWVPAIQNGRTVTAYMKQRVDFVVEKGKKTISIYNKTNTGGPNYTGLDPQVLYVGLDNWLVVKIDNDNIKNVEATISHGYIKKEDDKFIIRVNYAGETTIDFYTTENGKKISLKEISFNVRLVTQEPVAINQSGYSPKISASSLKKASIYDLLQLDRQTEIVGFNFSIDKITDSASIKYGATERNNTGNQFNAQTVELIRDAIPGNTIMIDNIKIKKDGREKKIPSMVYYVVD